MLVSMIRMNSIGNMLIMSSLMVLCSFGKVFCVIFVIVV